jgi:hypothetical protein
VNILDENILESQRPLLRRWRIPIRQIGAEAGRKGMSDQEIIVLLQQLRQPTFFTRDVDFYRRDLCHARYCLVWLDVAAAEAAEYIRRLLRHKENNTQAKRMGAVIRLSPTGLSLWKLHAEEETYLAWRSARHR